MKIEMTEGCVSFSYRIDGKEFVDLSLEEQKNVVHKLVDRVNDPGSLQQMFRDMVIDGHTEYHCSEEPCDCCGDYIETYKLEI